MVCDAVTQKIQWNSWEVLKLGWPFRIVLTGGQGLGFILCTHQSLDLGCPQKRTYPWIKRLSSVEVVPEEGWQLKAVFWQHSWHLVCKSSIPKGGSGWHIVASNTLVYHKQSWTCSLHLHQAVLSWAALTALAHEIIEQMLLSLPTSSLPWHFTFLAYLEDRPVMCFVFSAFVY